MGVFDDKGFEDATVADILDAASVARRTFYRHFTSKEDVLEELYKMSIRALGDEMAEAARDADDVWVGTMRGLDAYLDFHVSNSKLLLTMLTEASREASPLFRHRQQYREALIAQITIALEQRSGRRYDPNVAEALLGALDALSMRLLRGTASSGDLEPVRAVLHGLLDLVCRVDAPLPLAEP